MTDYQVRRNRILPAIARHSAVTIRHTIYIHPDRKLTPRLLRHELVHVRQWEQHGWTFPLRYIWQHIRHGYSSNRFEIEARRGETK